MYRHEVFTMLGSIVFLNAIGIWDYFYAHYAIRSEEDIWVLAALDCILIIFTIIWFYWLRKKFYNKYPHLIP